MLALAFGGNQDLEVKERVAVDQLEHSALVLLAEYRILSDKTALFKFLKVTRKSARLRDTDTRGYFLSVLNAANYTTTSAI